MSFEQQIKIYEDRIMHLEEMKRSLLSKSGYFSEINDKGKVENWLNRINVDLEENWEHVAILKIRKMMGF